MKNDKLQWRTHTANLLAEIMKNEGTAILKIPLNIFLRLLLDVAKRASEINDPQLNALMMRLTLYDVADPVSSEYDPKIVEKTLKAARLEQRKK